MLPELQSLVLGLQCYLAEYADAVDESSITELETECTTEIYKSGTRRYAPFRAFFGLMPCLKNLTMGLSDARSIGPGNSVLVVDMLRPVASTLEVLRINSLSDMSFLDGIAPAPTLTEFQHLRELTVPPELILPAISPGQRHLTSIIPDSIEILAFDRPTKAILGWMKDVLVGREYFSHRKKIRLLLRMDRGMAWYDIQWRRIRVLRRLRKAGVEIVMNVPREWRKEWELLDFDPAVSDIVDFLGGLTA